MTTLPRFLDVPQGSFFLFGPRGTGKTTWLREKLPDALVLDLLRAEEFRRFAARPERLRELVRAAPPGGDVVVDEIQRVPELLNVVHELMESGKRWRFVLTGSSARTLRRGGVNLLAGRAIMQTMHPFMAGELGSRFDLRTALTLGTVATVLSSDDPRGVGARRVRDSLRRAGSARRGAWPGTWAVSRGSSKPPHSPTRRRST